ncbi:MAG: trypsin-like peptidase domain-containing protein [Tepidisphaeraceae bacterium]
MKSFRSGLGVSMLSIAAIAAGYFGGRPLLDHMEFARAENTVEANRQELSTVQDLSTVFRRIDKVVEPSVVKIVVTRTTQGSGNNQAEDMMRRFFRDHGGVMPPGFGNDNDNGNGNQDEQPQSETVEGSGVIIEASDGNGYILTNNHVAKDANTLTISLSDGRVIKNGKVLGTDPKSDLAVIEIQADRLIPATWGDSDELEKGDWVLAFGSPFDFVGSMTHGIVSALNRETDIGETPDSGVMYQNFIQVDAPINPGNSGGPLVNIHGEVVGINTAIVTDSGGFQGIGFAIPSNQAKAVYTALKEHGAVVRGWLGVRIGSVADETPGLIKSYNYTASTGVFVEEVYDNTPATGKLHEGDIIMALNGKKVDTRQELRDRIADTAPGDTATLKVWRDGKEQDVDITIGKQPENLDTLAQNDNGGGQDQAPSESAKQLGMTLQTLDADTAKQLQLGDVTAGAVITNVDPNSPAATAGLQQGMVITDVGRTKVHNAQEAASALSKADLKQGIRLYVASHDGKAFFFLQNADQ